MGKQDLLYIRTCILNVKYILQITKEGKIKHCSTLISEKEMFIEEMLNLGDRN